MSANIETTTIKSSPWGKVTHQTATPCSLREVMSEQLADELNQEELTKLSKSFDDNLNVELIANQNIEGVQDEPVDNDYLLASLLQLEFDKEYDEILKRYEEHKNKNSKVKMSYDNFKILHPIHQKDMLNETVNDNLRHNDEELFSSSDSDDGDLLSKLTFKNGVHGKGENMISKHDLALTALRNGSRVMNFPPEFETGDGHTYTMHLSNKVFNTLKVHSMHETKRHNRLHDKEEKATAELALDPKTRLILYKLVNADILESIGGVISTGKEALILSAAGGQSEEFKVPKECVCKVYKTTLNEFKTRSKYIRNDYRFKDRYKHLNPRKIVKMWAEKEMHNLRKIGEAGILCPEVVVLKKHVLVMSLVGNEDQPAPKLKDVVLNEEQLRGAYKQCVQILTDLYNKCKLIHADFSEYNLLYQDDKLWVIDVSQSIEIMDPVALEYLYRDCRNVNKFFTNKELENVLTTEELFNKVTGHNFTGVGDEFLSKIQQYTKNKQMEVAPKDEKLYNFDYYFEKSLKDKNNNAEGGQEYEEDEDDYDDDEEEYCN